MALHQYIGARYVPKFYENSLGTAEWEGGVIYEPLTIVTWNGNSYTSKKTVPANIGDPSANPSYWVATGVFNQQLADLSTTVNGLIPRIDNLEDVTAVPLGKIIMIGDSYSTGIGYNSQMVVSDMGWVHWFEVRLGLTRNTNCFYCDTRTGGFVDDGSQYQSGDANRGFVGQIKYLAENLSAADRAAVTDIIVAGGWNDISSTFAVISANASAFNTYVRTYFQNARVSRAFIGGTMDAGYFSYLKATCGWYKKIANMNSWRYITNSELVSRNSRFYSPESMGVGLSFHPNDYEPLSDFLIGGFLSGACDVWYDGNASLTLYAEYTAPETYVIVQRRGENSAERAPKIWNISIPNGYTGVLANGVVIGQLSNSIISSEYHRGFPCSVVVKEGSTFYSGPGVLSVGPDGVMVRQYLSDGTGAFRSYTLASNFRICFTGECVLPGMDA